MIDMRDEIFKYEGWNTMIEITDEMLFEIYVIGNKTLYEIR